MSKNEWSTTYLVLEVGERKTPLKWTVTNCLFKHLQTDNLAADKEMNKKEIFVLSDKSSPGIPVLDVVVDDADVGTAATGEIGDDIPEACVVLWRQKR